MKVSRRLKKLLAISFGSLYLTGVGYWLTSLFLKRMGEFGEEPHPLERVLGPIHLVAALGMIFVLGIFWENHIRAALKSARHRVTGWGLLALFGLMAGSGITILYGSESIIHLAEKVHPWIGTSLLPVMLFHSFVRVRARRTVRLEVSRAPRPLATSLRAARSSVQAGSIGLDP